MTSTNVPIEDESVLVPIADVDSIILLKKFNINRTFVKMFPQAPFQRFNAKGESNYACIPLIRIQQTRSQTTHGSPVSTSYIKQD